MMEERRREMIPQIKKILYATDLSKNSSYAFLYAVDLAKRREAKIVILHVIEPIPAYVEAYTGMTAKDRERQREETIEMIKKHLEEFCKKAENEIGSPCMELISKIVVSQGYPPEEILNTAEKEDCNVIVLGNHGKGFLAHTFLGSVSSSVLNRTRKPVFIIPLPSEKVSLNWNGI